MLFSCRELSSISLPPNLKEIGNDAFAKCESLKSIHIPDSVKSIGYGAFRGCSSLESIYIPACDIKLYNDEVFGVYWYTADSHVFYDCRSLRIVEFGFGTKVIDAKLFRHSRNIEELIIPDGVERVDSLNQGCLYRTNRITASEQWKKEHYRSFECLSTYGPKGGCYVATAVYGSYDCPEVWTLRRYRDYSLAETWYGRAFIKLYY